MQPKHILNTADHRPWSLPTSRWKFYQEWNDVIFLHWQVEFETLRKFVPRELVLDSFENRCWVSLVAFTMNKVRLRYLPPFSPISDFHEVNIRTYVKSGNKDGVYFLSIEGGNRWSCRIARKASLLPYRYSEMIRNKDAFISKNPDYNDFLSINYTLAQSSKKIG